MKRYFYQVKPTVAAAALFAWGLIFHSDASCAASPAATDLRPCFGAAARRYTVSRALLEAIARHESRLNPHAIHRNANGSEDIGLMQINDSWLPVLAGYGIRREHLFQPCVSIHVGAWILADNIRRYGPRWKAVGAYNAANPLKQALYVAAIQREFGRPR